MIAALPSRLNAALLASLLTVSAHAQDTLSLSCAVCHGEPGRHSAVPTLDALSAAQIQTALRAYRDGAREGTAMPRLARALSDADIDAIARAISATGDAR